MPCEVPHKNATCQLLAAAMPPSPRPAGQLNRYLRQCTPSAVAHRYVLVPAVLVPNQAAFPDTARLLPVMVPALAHASRPAGLLNSSPPAPWRTTAYTVPAEAAIVSMSPPREITRQCAPPS